LKNILIIGGARSGKSRFAQKFALKSGKPVLFVATAEAGDDEMRQRIEEHKRSRPPDWSTLEVTHNIGAEITNQATDEKVVIVDCITLLVNNIFSRHTDSTGGLFDTALIEQETSREIRELIESLNRFDASLIITNEVGMDLVPANAMGRAYRDALGKTNQLLAEECDEVYLMVAGFPLQIKPSGLS